MSTGRSEDFGDLTSDQNEEDGTIKWSWRFRKVSDLKINSISNRGGEIQ